MVVAVTWLLAAGSQSMADELAEVDSTRIAVGQFNYQTILEVGDTILELESTRQISTLDSPDSPRLLIETLTDAGMGPFRDQLELDARTLLPIRRTVRQGDGFMAIDFTSESITGHIQAAGQSVSVNLDLAEPVYAGESGLEALLAAAPLRAGLDFQLKAVEIDVNTHIRRFEVTVGALETVQVPAGSFDAWPVHLKAADEFDDEQTLWFSELIPRVFLRAEAPVPDEMGGGSLVTELVAMDD
jgi:hypothetical protein